MPCMLQNACPWLCANISRSDIDNDRPQMSLNTSYQIDNSINAFNRIRRSPIMGSRVQRISEQHLPVVLSKTREQPHFAVPRNRLGRVCFTLNNLRQAVWEHHVLDDRLILVSSIDSLADVTDCLVRVIKQRVSAL